RVVSERDTLRFGHLFEQQHQSAKCAGEERDETHEQDHVSKHGGRHGRPLPAPTVTRFNAVALRIARTITTPIPYAQLSDSYPGAAGRAWGVKSVELTGEGDRRV